jgi:hypothetical protein
MIMSLLIRPFMVWSIALDDQPTFKADEIDHIRANWHLSAELRVDAVVSHGSPEECFGLGRRGALCFRYGCSVRISLVVSHWLCSLG